jgi:hypothetical protein
VEKQTRSFFANASKITSDGDLFEAQLYVTGRMTAKETRESLLKCYTEQWPQVRLK